MCVKEDYAPGCAISDELVDVWRDVYQCAPENVMNTYSTWFLYCSSSSHAIYLPADLGIGSTASCKGFGSDRLSPTRTGDFEISEIEVWGFTESTRF